MFAPREFGAGNLPAPLYFCDGAIDPQQRGVAVAVARRAPDGHILETASRVLPRMTNNEAEYEAFILGLELALARDDSAPIFLLDSQIVVGQIAGSFAVRDPRLAARHARAARLLARLPDATVIFVPRERNLLADALAKEALAAGLEHG
ncbi:MAG: ribonuclease HI family protein [Anaerolineae bacterium]|nr:ribonuclease HI family protein [Anaerolineae bacterium]